jgi:hypothetical protein
MAMIKCEECGNEYSERAEKCPKCGCPNQDATVLVAARSKAIWSSGRLIIGIISMVLFALIAFQSCAVGMSNTIKNNHATSGTSGFVLAFLILIAGIVAVCTRNSRSKITTMIPTLFYWFGALLTVGAGATYGDLPIWSSLAFIFWLVFIIAGFKTKKG